MKETKINLTPKLSLYVQYADQEATIPRWMIRKWITRTIKHTKQLLSYEIKYLNFTVRLVDLREGKLLNKTFRDKNYATNILTFVYGTDNGELKSDLVICSPILYKEAKEQNKNSIDHFAHITIHGTLHALGFNHEEDQEALEMEKLEISILKSLKIGNPYEKT